MIRPATMSDADVILALVNKNAAKGLMLGKSPYAIYLAIPTMYVWEENGKIVGCTRLAVTWSDLAEISSLAVDETAARKGIGRALVEACAKRARELKIKRLFSLSYQVAFFTKCGFAEVDRNSLPYKVFGDCLNCPKVNCCDEHAFVLDL